MAEAKLEIIIIKPDSIVVEKLCDHVIVPGRDGDFGVSSGHTPFMTVVRPGILEIFEGEETEKYAIHDGFVTVEKNKVTIVCETIESEKEIDRERAESARKRAEKRLNEKHPDTDFRRAEAALKKALVRIEI